MGYIPSWTAAGVIAVTHGIPEVIVAVIVVVVLVKAINRYFVQMRG
jgi:hypothetical protein